MEYYFISYTCETKDCHIHDLETKFNDVINKHPLIWLKEKIFEEWGKNIFLVFYEKITEEQYKIFINNVTLTQNGVKL